jgi:beta-N-acetylhexosaminidase
MVRLGIESVLDPRDSPLSGERLGLITNPSGVDSELRTTIDLLHGRAGFDLRKLFGPEHGIRGRAQAGVEIEDTIDEKTGLLVESLYGEETHLRPEMIDGLDAVVYDMQDVGCRYYTLVYTLAYALKGVAEAGKRIVVLDRPNPVAPLGVAGNRIPDAHASFVGGYRLPITHGMTVGELARYFNEAFDIGADLRVVELEGWTRETWYDATGLPWVPPSPNVPTLDTAAVYPGTCFFEGTNLSEGRGTTKPFELIGAPWIDAGSWADSLDGHGLSGVAFRPAYFTPTFSKHAQERVEGVQVHVRDRDAFEPVRVGLTMLLSAFGTYPDCDWVADGDDYFIDRLAGGPSLRKTVDEAADDDVLAIANGITDRWDRDRESFLDARDPHLLY